MTKDLKNILDNWVNKYTAELLAHTIYKISDVENAKDLVQDTFLAASKNIHTFKYKSAPKTWLFSILNNKISDYYRTKYQQDKKVNIEISMFFTENGNWINEKQPHVWQNSEKNILDDLKFVEIMNYCLDNLPYKFNTLIKMKYYSDKKPKEICQELEINPTNMWQIMHRAKLKLRECIENGWFKNN
ncbi:MAG: sigma-70 family RNA polymerase sigma factor [Bacteroidales bacterium]|nr:sigma-70 family RNA polymerase sigma factor [Bacteroidales bacterium]